MKAKLWIILILAVLFSRHADAGWSWSDPMELAGDAGSNDWTLTDLAAARDNPAHIYFVYKNNTGSIAIIGDANGGADGWPIRIVLGIDGQYHQGAHNYALASFDQGQSIYLAFLYPMPDHNWDGIMFTRSIDAGQSWSAPVFISPTDEQFGCAGLDMDVTSSGGRIFIATSAHLNDDIDDEPDQIQGFVSSNQGDSWTYNQISRSHSNAALEPSVAGMAGECLVAWVEGERARSSASTQGGSGDWTSPRQIIRQNDGAITFPKVIFVGGQEAYAAVKAVAHDENHAQIMFTYWNGSSWNDSPVVASYSNNNQNDGPIALVMGGDDHAVPYIVWSNMNSGNYEVLGARYNRSSNTIGGAEYISNSDGTPSSPVMGVTPAGTQGANVIWYENARWMSSTLISFTEPPQLIYPPNGSQVFTFTPNLIWSGVPNADTYQAQVSSSAGFESPEREHTTTELSWTVAPDLFGGTWYWRARAHDFSGWSDWSAGWSFIVNVDIQPPTVIVYTPNGGETWDVGTTHNIGWNADDSVGVASHKIEYSTDGGSVWVTIRDWTNGDPNTYSWTVPNTPSNICRVRVSARDAANNEGSDISDNNFTIRNPDIQSPVVTVITPNGGEAWTVGQTYAIIWTATDNIGVTAHRMEYSTNSGSNWILIRDWTDGNPQSYSWTIPNTPSTQARVRISVRDADNNAGEDISNANFTILALDSQPPVVTVNVPNGGEVWDIGITHNITWTATDNVGVTETKFDYSTDSGNNWLLIRDWAVGNQGDYAWTVPDNPATTARVRVSARDGAGNIAFDISNGDFTISAANQEVRLSVPNGGEAWQVGSSHQITWNSPDGQVANRLEFSTDGGSAWIVIRDWTEGDPRQYTWTVPSAPTNRARVKVSCRDADDIVTSDISDTDFSIFIVDNQAPSVTVLAPNGGEAWDCQSVQNIIWNDNDNVGVSAYKMEYTTNSGGSWELIRDWTEGDPHTYAWTVPRVLSQECQVRITCRDAAGNSSFDVSNDLFTIRDGTAPQVEITGPANSDSIYSGALVMIDWNASDNFAVSAYKLDYSSDGGADWRTISDWANGNPQSYSWIVPEIPVGPCMTRVLCSDQEFNVGADTVELHINGSVDTGDDLSPIRYELSQCYPNPFNAQTTIEYTLARSSRVNIEILDVLGRQIETIPVGMQGMGVYRIIWDSKDNRSGVYFYRITAGRYSEIKKMVLLK